MTIDDLARAVYARRCELGLSAREVTARGGPTPATVTRIEAAEPGHQPHYITLYRLDVALRWIDGTARAYLWGDPIPVVVARSGELDEPDDGSTTILEMIADASTTEELYALLHHVIDELARRHAAEHAPLED